MPCPCAGLWAGALSQAVSCPCPCAGPWGRSLQHWLLARHNSVKGIGIIDFGLPAGPAASQHLSQDQDLREENKGKINSERSLAAAVPGSWVLVLVSRACFQPAMEKKEHSAQLGFSPVLSPWKEPRSPFLSQVMGC